MMVHITPKRLKTIAVDATFEHMGVPYSERFASRKRFLAYLKRTRDVFVSAVDYISNEVINKKNISSYSYIHSH